MRNSHKGGFLPTAVIFYTLFMFATLISAGTYSGGCGAPWDPYQISTAEDLDMLGQTPGDYGWNYILTADIDLAAYTFTTAVIAPDTDNISHDGYQGYPFFGVFDGANHKISHLTIDTAGIGNDYLGLFGQFNGRCFNLILDEVSISGGEDSWNIGGLCGWNSGEIKQCSISGIVQSGQESSYIGGLCGRNDQYGIISQCFSNISVIGGNSVEGVGGLCGSNEYGTIHDCYSIGYVAGSDWTYMLGGLCGYNIYGHIYRCFTGIRLSVGLDSMYVGGLIGTDSRGVTYLNFWDTQVSGQISSGAGVGRTTEQMMERTLYAGWGNDIWTMENGKDYPHLAWENAPGESITDPNRTYSGGNGTSEDPYRIGTPADLVSIGTYSSDWDKCFELINDIDISGFPCYSSVVPEFSGTFDGNGFCIQNLIINPLDDTNPGNDNVSRLGLFGKIIGVPARVSHLGLVDYSVASGNWAINIAGLCGHNDKGTLDHCFVRGNINGGKYAIGVGGLCGENMGLIQFCSSDNFVTGSFHSESVGDLCGSNQSGTILNCYSMGSVSCGDQAEAIGGLCGGNSGLIQQCYSINSISCSEAGWSLGIGNLCGGNAGIIQNCYSMGSVTCGDRSNGVGGLCGTNNKTIGNSFSTANVKSGVLFSKYIGGFCGNNASKINACFWDMASSGQSTSSGGTAMSTWEMMKQRTYTNAKWDFLGEKTNGTGDVWRMCGDGISYPRLSWEFSRGGDMNCPDGVGMEDLLYLAGRWMASTPEAVGAADGNGDGRIGIEDFAVMAENWMR